MNFKKFNRHIPVIVLCCIFLFILSCTSQEDDFKSAMDFYNNKDFSKAFQFFQALAEKKYAKAEYMLGETYYKGEGVSQDYKQAVHWYTKAAEQGSADAQFNLARMYHDGKGILKDNKQAVIWYTKAAEQGRAEAQYNVGLMYFSAYSG